MSAKRKPKAAKSAPCSTCGACPECGRAPAPQVTPMPPVIIVQPLAPVAAPVYPAYPMPIGPIWVMPQPQWVNPLDTPFTVTCGGSAVAGGDAAGFTSFNVPATTDIGNGYRPIWGQGAVS